METTPLLDRPRKKSFWSRFCFFRFRKRELTERTITIGQIPKAEFPPNFVCNQKYNIITFLPLVLFEQFRFFLNLYFLVMALSQFIPSVRIGYLYTYWGPLGFVLAVTLFREAVDDFRRYRRDKEVNRQRYERIVLDSKEGEYRPFQTEQVSGSALRVGDIVMLHRGQRVPADMILLRTNEAMGAVYIRTDQLDGEIDWKSRNPIPTTQKLATDAHLLDSLATVWVERPEQDIHSFNGSCRRGDEEADPLDIQNTMWSGCVIASGQATGLVVYTGLETRSVMNNATPRSKACRSDLQINDLTKVLFLAVLFLSFLLIVLKGFNGPWYGFLFRFLLLFSYIIPISLRVNLEIGKVYYCYTIQRDKQIAGTVMRTTTIPEELGRVQYLLVDKTGTLTKNEMVFKKLLIGDALFDDSNFHEMESLLTQYVTQQSPDAAPLTPPRRAWQAVAALALCHNVTPVYDVSEDDGSDDMSSSMSSWRGGCVPQQQLCDYQASSPDEVALVKWTDMMGVSLYARDVSRVVLRLRAANQFLEYSILQIFPFTSETKMMGIIVKEENTGVITYYVKGADVALSALLEESDGSEGAGAGAAEEAGAAAADGAGAGAAEEAGAAAADGAGAGTAAAEGAEGAGGADEAGAGAAAACRRLGAEGLRTLVVAARNMEPEEYEEFEIKYREARCAKQDRAEKVATVMSGLQRGLRQLAVTGVEDRLADDVPRTLEMLRAAGIKIWMLTGDKLETALCIARSLPLGVDAWQTAQGCGGRGHAHTVLTGAQGGGGLVIEGDTLEECIRWYGSETVSALCGAAGVVVARCSPTQKAAAARLLRARGAVVAAAGDGGNDVAMIQEADLGVGISGAEGRAASLAGDVSVRSLRCLARLLLVHGRRAATRSAALALFIVHRGLIVSTMQAVFSVVFYFSSVSLYPGFLMVGYGTVYTMLPVFSLVLDKDIPSSVALRYPQLYKQLTKGRQLSYKTFYIWTAISIYQGGVIMFGALVLFEDQLIHIVEISYTALILTELVMVALTAETFHPLMLLAELLSLAMYTATLLVFTSYFDSDFLRQWGFWWKVSAITLVSCLPLYGVKYMTKKWRHRQYRNIRR